MRFALSSIQTERVSRFSDASGFVWFTISRSTLLAKPAMTVPKPVASIALITAGEICKFQA